MKKTFFFSFLLILTGLTSCSPKNSKVQPLTYKGFLTQIWDCKKHPDGFVFEGKTAVIVDFYTPWCGPCRQLFPILEKMAAEYEGELVVYAVDAEHEKELSTIFNVQSFPTLLFIQRDVHNMKMYHGLPSEEKLRTTIEEELLGKTKQQ